MHVYTDTQRYKNTPLYCMSVYVCTVILKYYNTEVQYTCVICVHRCVQGDGGGGV